MSGRAVLVRVLAGVLALALGFAAIAVAVLLLHATPGPQ
jgi:hypothetical protein